MGERHGDAVRLHTGDRCTITAGKPAECSGLTRGQNGVKLWGVKPGKAIRQGELVGRVLTCLRFLCWSALRLDSHKDV